MIFLATKKVKVPGRKYFGGLSVPNETMIIMSNCLAI